MQAVDRVINAHVHIVNPVGVDIATVQIRNGRLVITFHVVNDDKTVAVAGRVPFGAGGRIVDRGGIIGLGLAGQQARGQGEQC